MKNWIYLFVCLSGCLMASCSPAKKDGKQEELLLVSEESTEVGAPERMQTSEANERITYKGKEYASYILRRPDASLPLVENEQGEQFVDNSITLRLTCGGKDVVNKVFTKQSFASLVDARFLKHAILEGMVFDEVTSQGIAYAASICYPQTDLYVPLRIVVAADGKISMNKEELYEDTGDRG